MNIGLGVLRDPLVNCLGWALVHSLWQGMVLASAFLFLRLLLRRRSPNARYVAGCVVLALMAVAPVVTMLSLSTSLPGTASEGLAPLLWAAPIPQHEPRQNSPDLSALVMSAANNGYVDDVIPWLVTAWFMGVAVFSSRLLLGWRCVCQLSRDGLESMGPCWIERFADLKLRLSINKPVRLLKSTLVEVPMVVGWLRPVILLPASTLTGLTPDQIEAILVHELAHVRRHDYLINAVQSVIETLMFYHPAVWWVSRCIREDREVCCDELAVQVCPDRLVYARALTALEEIRGTAPELAFAATGCQLLRRIRRLVGAPAGERPATGREIGALALLGIGLALFVVGVCLCLTPPSFRATARIRMPQPREVNETLAVGGSHDPSFIQTEFDVIESRAVLSRVVESLHLQEQLADRPQAEPTDLIPLLRSRIELKPLGSTDLVELSYTGGDPGQAADIVNKVARAYVDYPGQQQKRLALSRVQNLEEFWANQEAKMCAASNALNQLKVNLNISDEMAASNTFAPVMTAETLQSVNRMKIELTAECARLKTLLAAFKKLSPDELRGAILTAVSDDLLSALFEQLNRLQQKLNAMKQQRDAKDPELLQASKDVEESQRKCDQRIAGIVKGHEVRLTSHQLGLEGLDKEVAKATEQDLDTARKSAPYFEEKKKLQELQSFNEKLKLEVAKERAAANSPKPACPEIVEEAKTAARSTSPNRLRGAVLAASGSLMSLVGLLLVRTEEKTLRS